MTTWSNWAGNQQAAPARVVACHTTDDVVAAVRAASREGLTVKPVGAGHSFTDVAVTEGVQLNLDGLSGVVSHTPDGRVRVRAGTCLHDLNYMLDGLGLAMPNLGDIDVQSIAGAIATGTHGTGASFTGLAGFVTALQIVLADGSVVEASPMQRPDLFAAARLGLGAFGVVTEVEVACVPAFRIEACEEPMSVAQIRRDLDSLVDDNDHFEFFWFPYTSMALAKTNRRLEPGDTSGSPLPGWRAWLEDDLLTNVGLEAVSRLAAAVPATTRPLNAVASRTLSARCYTDRSYRVFATPRSVRFVETEYAVPREAVVDVLGEISTWLGRARDVQVTIPLEVRFAAADDVWLSAAYQRETAYVAVHQALPLDPTRYFAAFEDIVAAYGGRPHWGKLHRLDAARLRDLYPRFDDALRVRDEVDPGRLFANAYLDRVLG